jgi:aspartate oxidase
VGAGAAGLYSAVAASADGDTRVMIATAGELGAGGCSKRTHGLNAAINAEDSLESHYCDTLTGGGTLNDPKLARILCDEVVDRVREMEAWGVRFHKDKQRYLTGTYGGSTSSRSIHWYDISGLEITQHLVQRVILQKCVARENRWLLDIVRSEGSWQLAFYNQLECRVEYCRCSAVVLATGGGACVYPISSISEDKQATGIVLAYNLGAALVDMEMVQFHPTGLLLPASKGNGSLLEEEMRAQGGILLNGAGYRYMFDYDDRGEMATRDVVARATYMEIISGRGTANGGVMLDLGNLDRAYLAARFPHTVKRCRDWGVDILEEQTIEISPTAHFLMGGIKIDENCSSSLEGLFACGEDAGGIHGANRLGGNGLADALVFGFRAGKNASRFAKNQGSRTEGRKATSWSIMLPVIGQRYQEVLDQKMKKLMWRYAGLVRDESGLGVVEEELSGIMVELLSCSTDVDIENIGKSRLPCATLAFKYRLLLAQMIVAAARKRTNSIGAHFRCDAGDCDPGNTIIRKDGSYIDVRFGRTDDR